MNRRRAPLSALWRTSPVKEKQSMAREDSVRSVGDHEGF